MAKIEKKTTHAALPLVPSVITVLVDFGDRSTRQRSQSVDRPVREKKKKPLLFELVLLQ
jgi:hypothetical protein